MKQFNVRDETHRLGRELSIRTGKSLLNVISEALLLYRDKLEKEGGEDQLIDRFLREASSVIVERLCIVIPEALSTEVPKIVEATVEKLRKVQEEIEERQLRELSQLAIEPTLAEAEAKPLRDASYEETYGENDV